MIESLQTSEGCYINDFQVKILCKLYISTLSVVFNNKFEKPNAYLFIVDGLVEILFKEISIPRLAQGQLSTN